ncbi:terminase [[Micrococcus luteus] ATCC 49442]|uniref:terminase n=1 Tax=[Micrococcus luteus] ATCC 49442 TaxID=2698727 RepID=UPI0013DA490F|nr:terminase [[Micrococcus luteus] ATCC 49442]
MTEVPAHLGPAGRALYEAAVDEFELSLPELAALLQSAETLDTLRIIEDEIRKTGPVLPTGRPSPLLAEARQQRAILVRLLGLLDLRLDDEETPGENGVRPSVSRAARKAARARWSR